MSMFDKLRAWWTFKQNSGHRGTQRTYVLDAAGLFSQRRGGNRPSPSDHVQLLQRLARFAKKEQIGLTVVLEGKELREVRNGKTYQDVLVYFADRSTPAADVVAKVAGDALRRQAVTVITADTALEQRVHDGGAATMRTATFRKALDSVAGGSSERSSQEQRRRPRRRRRPQQRQGGGKKKPPETGVQALVDLVE